MEGKVNTTVHSGLHVEATSFSSTSRNSLDNNGTSNLSQDTSKLSSMAFIIDFGGVKSIDKSRLQHLARQSHARHHRVHSTASALPQRTSPAALTSHRPSLSAKLPRKGHGYTSEGYFSSDQEDSLLSASIKLSQSSLGQQRRCKNNIFTSSPVFDKSLQPHISATQKSKIPIIDSIMSKSDTLPSRHSLSLPQKKITVSYHDISSFMSKNSQHLNSIVDHSPDDHMLTDFSSPDLDLIVPVLAPSPEHNISVEMSDLFKNSIPQNEFHIVEDDRSDSSTGTYTIEADYSEEQKAKMSIDRTFGVDPHKENIADTHEKCSTSKERDPQLILNCEQSLKPNALEVSCSYEPERAVQKPIKSTQNYLQKIKERVQTIREKTFHKTPKSPQDEGYFTSVTACGVLAMVKQSKPHHSSLSKCQADKTDYVHHVNRESSVPICLSRNRQVESSFESSVWHSAHTRILDDLGVDDSSDTVVSKLSNLSFNRCRGGQTWIKDWAESVKIYNNTINKMDSSFSSVGPCPIRPRQQRSSTLMRPSTKIPSPLTMRCLTSIQDGDTSSGLTRTQAAITNLQAAITNLQAASLSRSNSLNYRLKRNEAGSPRRVVTGRSAGSFDDDSWRPAPHPGSPRYATHPTSPRQPATHKSMLADNAARVPPPHPAPQDRVAAAAPAVRYNRATQLRRDRLQHNTPSLSSTCDPHRTDRGARGSARERTDCGATRAGSSPCRSSAVHRSQSCHSAKLLESLYYSSDEDQVPKTWNRYRRELDKRKPYVLDDHKTLREYESLRPDTRPVDTRLTHARRLHTRQGGQGAGHEKTAAVAEDDRKTFVLDSDTNSTTNESSPRNSSVFSHDQTGASETDTAPPPPTARRAQRPARHTHRHSGDFSLGGGGGRAAREEVQPRYMDISRYRATAGDGRRADGGAGSGRRIEIQQRKAELEKWKRRASYDPRKSAAADKHKPPSTKTNSGVLRSQSFHGAMSAEILCYVSPPPTRAPNGHTGHTSDNNS